MTNQDLPQDTYANEPVIGYRHSLQSEDGKHSDLEMSRDELNLPARKFSENQ